jgi:hypothetical protein
VDPETRKWLDGMLDKTARGMAKLRRERPELYAKAIAHSRRQMVREGKTKAEADVLYGRLLARMDQIDAEVRQAEEKQPKGAPVMLPKTTAYLRDHLGRLASYYALIRRTDAAGWLDRLAQLRRDWAKECSKEEAERLISRLLSHMDRIDAEVESLRQGQGPTLTGTEIRRAET